MSERRDPLEAARAALRVRQGRGARYDASNAPATELRWARLGMAYFARKLNELVDKDLDGPSARSGWSRRRVIAACALQARAMAQAIAKATGGAFDEVAETDEVALDLAATLPPWALRHLVNHTGVHLDVTWRDLTAEQWDLPLEVEGMPGARMIRSTARLRAEAQWLAALDLGNGGRLIDAPEDFRGLVASSLLVRR